MTTATERFGPALKQTIEARLEQNAKQKHEREMRIYNCEVESTDCALSIWAASATEGLYESQLTVLKDGGESLFRAPLDPETLEPLPVTEFQQTPYCGYGSETRWRVTLANGEVVFCNPLAKRPSTFLKKGILLGWVRRAAWAETAGSVGMSFTKVYRAKWNRWTGEDADLGKVVGYIRDPKEGVVTVEGEESWAERIYWR